jgi:hypothetical protein
MDISKYKEALGTDFEAVQTYVNALIAQKDEARAESISGRKTLKAEVENLRKVKEVLFDKLGLDDDADLDSVSIPTKGQELEANKQAERRLKKLETELAAEREARTALDGKYKGTLTEAALARAISKHEFVDNDLVMEYVKGRIKFEGDELVYVDGDKTLSVEDGVGLVAKTKPHLLKAQGIGGSGYNPTATQGKTKALKDMSLTEQMNLAKTNKPLYDQLKESTTPQVAQAA